MRRYCAACGERMATNTRWLVLTGRVYHNSGSCERLYRQRLSAAINKS